QRVREAAHALNDRGRDRLRRVEPVLEPALVARVHVGRHVRILSARADVAQLVEAPGLGPGQSGFDSLRRHMKITELQTPALLVDGDALEHNLATMSEALPGPRLRPHVKAHKTTSLARRQAEGGHDGFTCATIRECE